MEEKDLQQQESQETNTPVTNKEPEWKNKARPAIYTMAGFYLAYLSWQMFHEISRTTGSEQTIMIVSSILFAVIGLGGILFGLTAGWRAARDQRRKQIE